MFHYEKGEDTMTFHSLNVPSNKEDVKVNWGLAPFPYQVWRDVLTNVR